MKKKHRFLLRSIPATLSFSIQESAVIHHIRTVLRLKEKEECIVFTEGGPDYVVRITSLSPKEIVCEKKEERPALVIPKNISVLLALTKRDTFEIAIQKLTELGVARITPLITERTIKQSFKQERIQKISDEAVEQSGRNTRVHIDAPYTLENALSLYQNIPFLYCDTKGISSPLPSSKTLALCVGPEGGWSEAERALFTAQSALPLSLSPTILRTETAAIVALYKTLWM